MGIFGMSHQGISNDNNEEDSSFEENLGDHDKFVQNMYSEVRRDEHPFELQDIN